MPRRLYGTGANCFSSLGRSSNIPTMDGLWSGTFEGTKATRGLLPASWTPTCRLLVSGVSAISLSAAVACWKLVAELVEEPSVPSALRYSLVSASCAAVLRSNRACAGDPGNDPRSSRPADYKFRL